MRAYSIQTVSQMLDCSPRTVKRLIAAGLIKAVDLKRGRGKYQKLHVTEREYRRYLESL